MSLLQELSPKAEPAYPGGVNPNDLTARLERVESQQERTNELLEELIEKLNDLADGRDFGPGYTVEG